MVFSSTEFLFVYLPITLLIYFLTPLRARNWVLFAVSLVFYGWEKPAYVTVMLVSVISAWVCGFPIGKYRETAPKKAMAWLWVSLGINLSLLLFFKYTNFFIETLRLIPPLAGVLHPIRGLTLPVGISFYTFQIMSYSIDLWRGEIKTQRSLIAFGTYVALFPQLIAGPIVRYRDVETQLISRTHTVEKLASGIRRFTAGFAKKILLGDALAALYAYFSTSADLGHTALGGWMMVITYTLHIYFDFSGYSDMAIGLGRMLGFEFPENFNYPYIAATVTDFWRRWHITLSTWFRAYVYIPLGGNRRGRARQYLNLAAVWLLTGFWHGASWSFVVWGVWYLFFLVLEKAFLLRFFAKSRLTAALGHVWTLLIVGMGWMIFDKASLPAAFSVMGSLVGIGTAPASASVVWTVLHSLPLVCLSVVAATPFPARLWRRVTDKVPVAAAAEPLWLLGLLALSVACMVSGAYSPFLYFIF